MLWLGKMQSNINLLIAPLSRVQLSVLVLRSLETINMARRVSDLLPQGQSELNIFKYNSIKSVPNFNIIGIFKGRKINYDSYN